jgi:hypothetical protein
MTPRSIALFAATLAAFGMTVTASAQAQQDGAPARSHKARVHKHAVPPMIASRREACTRTGCQPLPPGCHTTMEQTWVGPTGYEIIHCP